MAEDGSDRNAEIWSTRVQRELLALTTENAPEQDKKDTHGVLPPFMKVKDHQLDIAAGICVVSFLVEITGQVKKAAVHHSQNEQTQQGEQTESTTSEGETEKSEEDPKEVQAESKASGDQTETVETKRIITIMLDASLAKKADGTLDTHSPAYPFLPPRAILAEGSSCFPSGSTIKDGDPVVIDCDWTPSLHLSDAVLNIGLKVKESILQDEPFHAAREPNEGDQMLEDMLSGARAIGSKLGKSFQGFGFKGEKAKKQLNKGKKEKKPAQAGEIRIGDEIHLLEPPWVESQGIYSCKAVRRPEFVEAAIQHAALEKDKQVCTIDHSFVLFLFFNIALFPNSPVRQMQ